MREKQSVEDVIVDHGEATGWEMRKTIYAGRRSCPDRHAYGYGWVVVMECKRPNGGHLSGGQVRERKRLQDAGFKVWVVEDPEHGKRILDWHRLNPNRQPNVV